MYELYGEEILKSEEVVTSVQIAIVRTHYGFVKQCNVISDTATEKIYQWQIFDVEQQKYINDPTNNTVVNIDGVDYTPVNGRIVINKT